MSKTREDADCVDKLFIIVDKNHLQVDSMREKYLDERLIVYGKSDHYPFHMPGHKRQISDPYFPYEIDITEIDGFDNLHHAEGILKEAQQRAARLYGARGSYFLVNGSTCGILAAVSASVRRGGKILLARNCHKAVYHAAYLRELSVCYAYPAVNECGIQGEIAPDQIRRILEREQGIEAVVITSPTYDGIISDIEAIAQIVHAHKITLIVDEAHGAHFGFHPYFPQTSVRLGADIVIQSMHKTLPSLTQSALLHVCSSLADEERIRRFLGIYETSSPSYVIMAGMDRCIRLLEEKSDELFADYVEKINGFYERSKKLTGLKVPEFSRDDRSKILIFGEGLGLEGKRLYDILLCDYHLQMEMYSKNYVLAMTSFMDKKQAYARLLSALNGIEQRFSEHSIQRSPSQWDFIQKVYRRNQKIMEIWEAWDAPHEEISLTKAADRIAGEFVSLYPPGIPLLVPGELITREMTENIRECERLGLSVFGVSGNLMIQVVISRGIHYT